MSQPVDALLFDLGRVLIDIDMSRIHARWATLAGRPADRIDPTQSAKILGHEVFRQHERGQVSDAIFFAHVRGVLEYDLTDAQMLDGWNSIFIGEVPGIRAVLQRVAAKLPLYVFSNTNAAHVAHWSVHYADLLRPFSKVYVSNTLGHRKPEAAAFQAVTADMGVAPGRVLFFDDVADNVSGARLSGLQAVQVVSAPEIMAALDALGL
jgi:glucose-1-phosphatase